MNQWQNVCRRVITACYAADSSAFDDDNDNDNNSR